MIIISMYMYMKIYLGKLAILEPLKLIVNAMTTIYIVSKMLSYFLGA